MKLKTSSFLLVLVLYLLILILPSIIILQWVFIGEPNANYLINSFGFDTIINTPNGLIKITSHHFNNTTQTIGIAGSLTEIFPLWLGLFILATIFKNYYKNNIFGIQNSIYYRRLGYLFILDGLIFQPISQMLLVLCATLSNPVGSRYITFSFGRINISEIFIGIIITIIAKVMLIGYGNFKQANNKEQF